MDTPGEEQRRRSHSWDVSFREAEDHHLGIDDDDFLLEDEEGGNITTDKAEKPAQVKLRHRRQSSVTAGEDIDEDGDEDDEEEDEEEEDFFLGTSLHIRNLQVINFPVMSADCGLERYCIMRLGRGRAKRKTKARPPKGSETMWETEEFKFAPEGKTVRRLIIQVIEKYPKKKEKDGDGHFKEMSPSFLPTPSETLSKRKGKGLLLGKMSSSREYCVGYAVVVLYDVPVNKGRQIELPFITEEISVQHANHGSDEGEIESGSDEGIKLRPSVKLEIVMLHEPGTKEFKVAKPAPAPQPPVFCGHLRMRTRVIKRWKTRWVTLDGRALRWYDASLSDVPMTRTEEELLARGTLKLRHAEVYVVPVAKGQKVKEDKGVTFAVETQKLRVLLYAPVETAIWWIDTIKQQIKQATHEAAEAAVSCTASATGAAAAVAVQSHPPSIPRQRAMSSGDDSGNDAAGSDVEVRRTEQVQPKHDALESEIDKEKANNNLRGRVAMEASMEFLEEEDEVAETHHKRSSSTDDEQPRLGMDEEDRTMLGEDRVKTSLQCDECRKWISHANVAVAKKAGYLSLRSSARGKKAKKRYCILFGRHLTTYSSPKDVATSPPIDCIHIAGAEVGGNKYDPSTMVVETRLEEWEVTAESLREGERWFIALEDASLDFEQDGDEGGESHAEGRRTQAEADIEVDAANQLSLSALRHEIVRFMDVIHPIDRAFDRVVDVVKWRHVGLSWSLYLIISSILLFPRQGLLLSVATAAMIVLWKRSNPDKHLFPSLFIKKKPPVGVIAKAQNTKRKIQKFQNKLRLWNGRADAVKAHFRTFVSQPFERLTWEALISSLLLYLVSLRHLLFIFVTIAFAKGTFLEDDLLTALAKLKEKGKPMPFSVREKGKRLAEVAGKIATAAKAKVVGVAVGDAEQQEKKDETDGEEVKVEESGEVKDGKVAINIASPARVTSNSAKPSSTPPVHPNAQQPNFLNTRWSRFKRMFSRKAKGSKGKDKEKERVAESAPTSRAHSRAGSLSSSEVEDLGLNTLAEEVEKRIHGGEQAGLEGEHGVVSKEEVAEELVAEVESDSRVEVKDASSNDDERRDETEDGKKAELPKSGEGMAEAKSFENIVQLSMEEVIGSGNDLQKVEEEEGEELREGESNGGGGVGEISIVEETTGLAPVRNNQDNV
eukprot:CAMPEP_0113873908 /NCGR_PEP_ID=MMETSP0780_2-20120614/4036_1 /TAXON_ID=652834 /ORGANISM="Palpitomonas bilix" /LENGTH=1169 /DNA_ID=CAMNT_0000859615 /DNA_START=109 /DNA_END=3618 /DNA_ORIENTATION=+ /assembly_acc=CAM_ASM_000599